MINQISNLIKTAKTADALIDFVRKLDQRKSGQLIELLTQRNLLFQLVSSQKNKIDYLEKIITLDRDIHAKLAQQMKEFDREVLGSIFNLEQRASTAGDILAAHPEFTQDQIKQIAEKEAKIRQIGIHGLMNIYTESLQLALIHKNFNFVYYMINQYKGAPKKFGQLAQIALNAKLHIKDIKVSITDAKVFHVDFCPIAFALFACSKGFLQALNENNISFAHTTESHTNLITIGVCSNMKDDIELLKQFEKKLPLNYNLGIISALLSQNKRILNYLMAKSNFNEEEFEQYKKYLTPDHIKIISQNFKISASLIKMISSNVDDSTLLKLMKKIQI